MGHTKGKWILNESKSQIVSENDCTKNGGIDIIAQCYTGFNYETTMPECQANAKLISAAPDMLEALIDIVEWDLSDVIDKDLLIKITNAINKATK